MMRPRILVVAGIRSQYMKVAALQRVTEDRIRAQWLYLDVGQHYDDELASQYVREYSLHFDERMTCGRAELSPTEVLARMMTATEHGLAALSPDVVMVLGDANCTVAAGLAVTNARLPVAHLEAGVRTRAPTTEERNRKVVDALSSLHLAASSIDLRHLADEGKSETAVFTGDVVRDLAHFRQPCDGYPDGPYAVLTLHRSENTIDLTILRHACSQITAAGLGVYFLGHPRVLRMLERSSAMLGDAVTVLPSTTHSSLLCLLAGASIAVTDSGALQREAFYVGKRAVVLQDDPFWPSLVQAGYNVAVSPMQLTPDDVRRAMQPFDGVFQDFGTPPVAERVADVVEDWARELLDR